MLIDPARAAYDKLQASVREYRKISPHTRDKRYGEGLTFEDFKTRYDAGTDFRQPTYSGQPIQPLQSASGGLGGLQLSNGVGPRPTIGNLGQEYKSDDPIRQGFFDSTFFKPNAPSTMDVVNYTYQGNPMGGSSSQISQFRNYLDSIGKGDLLVNQNSGALAQAGSGLGAPPQGIDSLTPAPQQPMMPTMPGNTMPENTMGGINSLSEFGKPPSLGGNNSFGNPFMGNTLGGNDNQGMSNYIDNLINQRMKDIFGGIMGIFK